MPNTQSTFEWPFTPDAAMADLLKFMPDSVDFKRALSDTIGKLYERDRAVEDNLTVPSGTVPVYASDPSTLTDGMLWINSTSGQLKVRVGGVTKIVTIT